MGAEAVCRDFDLVCSIYLQHTQMYHGILSCSVSLLSRPSRPAGETSARLRLEVIQE